MHTITKRLQICNDIKGAVTDMGYFVSSKFSRNLVQKENFTLV